MPESFETFWNRELWGNAVSAWVIAIAMVVAVTVFATTARTVLARKWRKLAQHTKTSIDDTLVDLLSATRVWFFAALGVVAATFVLELPDRGSHYVRVAAVAISLLQVGIWGGLVVDMLIRRHFQRDTADEPQRATGAAVLRVLALAAVWSVVLLMFLANLGVDITALVAGLGVGGIALALALQNVLGDLFASISILMDKPFEVGDFIIVGDEKGTVEKIGVKSVRVRSLGGEQLVFANNDLLTSRIRNYKRMQERRIVFRIGVVYQTPLDKVKAIPQILKDVVESTENTRFDRAHFAEYGDSDLQFEVVYYVLSPDYTTYMDAQQRINVQIFERFGAEDIDFAYPSRTLYTPQLTPQAVAEALRKAS